MTETEFLTETLDNGLTVIGEHNPLASSMAVGYFVNTGSRDETPEVAGVSHFLEHMMFKGTERRSAEDINREFDELGASYNAYTSEERTVYYGAVLPEAQPRLVDLLSDMMRPALRQADFDIEKNVILEEIAMYEDMPLHRVFDSAGPRFYNGHPLGNSVLGTVRSITDLSRDAMHGYFERRYAPNNLVLAAAGRFDWQALLKQVEQLTAGWQPATVERDLPVLVPATGSDRLVDQKLTRSHFALFAPAVSAQSDLRHAASLLANVLSDHGGSRLYWSLIDPGLADSVVLQFDGGNDHAGVFMGYVSTEPARADEVRDLFISELRGIQDNLPTEAEWQAARNKVATSVMLGAETPFVRLMGLGNSWLYRGEYTPVDTTVSRILNSPLADAERLLAGRPFDSSFVLELGPER